MCASADVPALSVMQSYCHLLRWNGTAVFLLSAAFSASLFYQLVFLFVCYHLFVHTKLHIVSVIIVYDMYER